MSPAERVQAAPRVALYLDFDGTLAPIVPRPQDALLPHGVRESLDALAANPRFTIAIVSGRELEDLRNRVGINGLVYAGNHGLEISGPGLRFEAEAAVTSASDLRVILASLRQSLAAVPGAEVEDKGLTASIHYRQVEPAHWTEVEQIVKNRMEGEQAFSIKPAKMVWEIRPRVNWNKGNAVLWIREKLGLSGALEVYIGDDATDEDAYAALPDAITIRVGTPGPTAARYRFPDPQEVEAFLRSLSAPKEAACDAR